jgi:hypothetical protein
MSRALDGPRGVALSYRRGTPIHVDGVLNSLHGAAVLNSLRFGAKRGRL